MPEGSAIAKALDYSLNRWIALTRYLDDGAVPIDSNRPAMSSTQPRKAKTSCALKFK